MANNPGPAGTAPQGGVPGRAGPGRRARGAGPGGDSEEVEFSLILYADQISLNVAASTLGREWVAALTAILGPPKLPATVKCSCSWGQGVVGAMLLVLWDLPAPDAALLLRNLHAFLGSALPSQT